MIERLARDLREAFPEMKGFSRVNLLHMRAFADAWQHADIVQQLAGQLPWFHNAVLITRLKAVSLAPLPRGEGGKKCLVSATPDVVGNGGEGT